MCKGLSRHGVEVHVLTIRIDPRIPNDFDLLSKVPNSVDIHRTFILDPWLGYVKWRKSRRQRNLRGPLDRIVSGTMRLITIPDHQIFWIPSVVQCALKVIREHDIKTILVTSPPVSTLLAGIVLKKVTGIRFLADLRDPIVGNIAQVNLIDPRDIFSKLERKLLEKIESRIITNADVVIANTETHRKELSEKYGTGNIHCVHNCFDEDDYKGIQKEKYEKFTIAHVGSMYGLRKADILFAAIKKLEQELQPDPLNFEVIFVGLNDPALHRSAQKYGVEKYVSLRGMVPHTQAIEIMTRSHLLLLIKAMGEDGLGQIPAKFFEYLGAGNKILYLGPTRSEVANIMNYLGCGSCFQNDKDGLYRFLRKEYLSYADTSSWKVAHYDASEYTYSRMGKTLAELLA